MVRFLSTLVLLMSLAAMPVTSWAAADSKAVTQQEMGVLEETAPAAGDAHAQEHGEGGLPQLKIGTYPSQIFWLLVMFAVMYIAFSKSILPTIGSVVEGRDNIIKGNLDRAQSLKDEAQAIQIAYEKNLEISRAKAVQAVQEVELASKKKANDQIESFRKRAEGEMGQAEIRMAAAKDRAMGDMSHVAAEVASIAAEKITGIGTDVQKARAIVDTIAGKAKAA